jgi:peptidoglycan/LPS O-acetylase OafA/YrhL
MSGITSQSRPAFRSDIESLRAIAVLMVVLFHGFPRIAPAGYLGVDVFFVISGYLITKQITNDLEHGRFSLWRFYSRRIRRLLPAFAVCVATIALVGAVLFLPADFETLGKALQAASLGYANHNALQAVDYFSPEASNAPLLHTWSLSVEEQFYVVLPLLLWVASRGRRPAWFWMCAILGIASAGAALQAEAAHPDHTFYLMPYRAWELLIGGLLTQLPALRAGPRIRGVLCASALAILVGVCLLGGEGSPFLGRLMAVAGAALLIFAQAGPGALVMRLLEARAVQAFGRASYSIYLWHWPVLVFVSYVSILPASPVVRLAAVVLSVVLGFVSWRFVEVPTRRAPWRAWGYALAVGSIVVLAGTGFIIGRQGGMPGRLPGEVVTVASLSKDRDQVTFKCRNPKSPIDPAKLCKMGEATGPLDWVVWGDSHAWALQESYSQWLAGQGQQAALVAYFGCPPVVGVERHGYHRDCRAVGEAAMAYVERERPKNVVLVSIWTDYLSADLRDGLAASSKSDVVLSSAIERTVRRLRATGARVWIMDPMPQAKADVPSGLARGRYFGTQPDLRFSQSEYAARNAPLLEVFSRLDGEIFARISPQDVLCQRGYCQVTNGGRPLYFDSNHLALSQSGYMAGVIAGTLDYASDGSLPASYGTGEKRPSR